MNEFLYISTKIFNRYYYQQKSRLFLYPFLYGLLTLGMLIFTICIGPSGVHVPNVDVSNNNTLILLLHNVMGISIPANLNIQVILIIFLLLLFSYVANLISTLQALAATQNVLRTDILDNSVIEYIFKKPLSFKKIYTIYVLTSFFMSLIPSLVYTLTYIVGIFGVLFYYHIFTFIVIKIILHILLLIFTTLIYTVSVCVFIGFIKPFLLIGAKNSPIQLLSTAPGLIILLLFTFSLIKYNFFIITYYYFGITLCISLLFFMLVLRKFKISNVLIN